MTRARLLRLFGLLCSVLPPLLATVEYFPIWVREGGKTALSGAVFFCLLLSALPLLRAWRRRLRSPSIPLLFGLLWGFLTLFRRIIDGVIAVCFFGMLGNLVGLLLFRLAAHYERGVRRGEE
jgi:hypothetical protein